MLRTSAFYLTLGTSTLLGASLGSFSPLHFLRFLIFSSLVLLSSNIHILFSTAYVYIFSAFLSHIGTLSLRGISGSWFSFFTLLELASFVTTSLLLLRYIRFFLLLLFWLVWPILLLLLLALGLLLLRQVLLELTARPCNWLLLISEWLSFLLWKRGHVLGIHGECGLLCSWCHPEYCLLVIC